MKFVHEQVAGAPIVLVAHTARHTPWSLVSRDDVVLCRFDGDLRAGTVLFNIMIGNQLACCVSIWQRASASADGACSTLVSWQ